MAHLSGDSAMIEAFVLGKDIHTATAAEIFGMPEALITKELRWRAKALISEFYMAKVNLDLLKRQA